MGWNDRLADPNSYGDLYPHLRAPRYSEAFLERAEPADNGPPVEEPETVTKCAQTPGHKVFGLVERCVLPKGHDGKRHESKQRGNTTFVWDEK